MEKPASKQELLKGIHKERQRLESALKGISPSDMAKASRPDAWSVKDILAHLSYWETYFIQRYEAGVRGKKQVIPEWSKPGVLDAINLDVYERNVNRSLPDILKEFRESYQHILEIVTSIPEADMFAHDRFEWTGKNTLADYIAGNTSEHYEEHLATIEAIKNKL